MPLFVTQHTTTRKDEHDPGPCVAIARPDMIVRPRKGRMIVFGSGRENPHRVTRVRSGTRYVLSFWFTCDQGKTFKTFLDGKNHRTFDDKKKQQKKSQSKREKVVDHSEL